MENKNAVSRLSMVILAILAMGLLLIKPCPDVTVEPIKVPCEQLPPRLYTVNVTPDVECVFNKTSKRYTEELVYIKMCNKEYPWQVQVINGKYQIYPEYIDNGIWIVTVKFKDWDRKYIFDERM